MTDLTETDKAYLAGYLDADGCISADCTENETHSPIRVQCRISGRNKPLLEELEFLYGGSITQKLKILEDKRVTSHWEWKGGMKATILLLEDVVPYLRLKKRRGELALEYMRTIIEPGHSAPLDVLLQRAKLALKICELTQAGKSYPRETLSIQRLQEFINKHETASSLAVGELI